MIGIVMISHGGLAEGVLSSASMLFPNMEKVETVALWPDDNPDDFQAKLEEKIKAVDDGEGVFILADLLGGTPSNRAMYFIGDKVKMLAGLSLPMITSLLAMREAIEDLDELVNTVMEEVRTATVYVNDLVSK